MTSSKGRLRSGRKMATAGQETGHWPVIYVHGIGVQPAPDVLKRNWDVALFGKETDGQTRMAYWADCLHGERSPGRTRAIRSDTEIDVDALLREAKVPADSDGARLLSMALAARLGARVPATKGRRAAGTQERVLLLPAAWRKPLARLFLERFIKDTAAYFFGSGVRERIQERLKKVIPAGSEPLTIVAHSQGTIIALEVLAALAASTPAPVALLVTIGSPLGIQEVQDFLSCPPRVPRGVQRWYNFADPFDPVALDKGLGDDFTPHGFIVDRLVSNLQARRPAGFSPHAAAGYLALPEVREVVYGATGLDMTLVRKGPRRRSRSHESGAGRDSGTRPHRSGR